ncbi:hypothetical protein G9A89_011270 [Geosiphon pyriformis]|nr:hypothetical protein G9A89_011270 [Geosiphon pyriformis]
MTDFGLTNEYQVHNGLDQGEKNTTARLNLATTLRKKLGKLLENISTIDTIESLSIIQKTQPKPSDPSKPSDITNNFISIKHQVTGLLFNSTTEIITCIILQRTSTDNTKPKVAESENIEANHLGFAKSLFQYYFNEKIFSLLGTSVNTESARETFYKELIQNTNLPTNHNFASIITEINKEIEHHTQQRYPITYASKGKGKLQTPPPAWKKNRVESPSNSSYHYTPGSTINISLTDTRQRKTELLGPYNFGISDLWEAAESKKEEKKSEDQEFTYLHPIPKNLEVETPNIQTQQQLENPEIEILNIRMLPNPKNQNPELINQQNLPPVIQSLQLPPQQPGQQQLLQQPPQPPNLDPMAYALIAKLDNFTGKENDYQSLINKPQDFNAFKVEFLRYFSNNNSINCLVNAFTIMKQGETKAVTTYLGRFHQNLRQIQAIDDDYFTAPQILNQFICGLRNAITCARDFESAESKANHAQAINLVMNGLSELDSKLKNLHNDTIIKEIIIVVKINHVHLHQPINSGNKKHVSATIMVNKDISKLTVAIPKSKPTHLPTSDAVISLLVSSISTSNLSAAATSNISTTATNNLSTPTDPNTAPKLTTQQNPKTENDSTELEIGNGSSSTNPQFFTATIWITPAEFSLLVTPEDTSTNNLAFTQKQQLTSNIPPATITKDESLAAIFPFKFEKTATMPLFSGAALEAKLITTMYTDTKVEGQFIKLILDSGFAGSIITRQLMDQLGHQVNRAASARIITADGATKTPIGEIDDFLFEVNGIVTSIKVLVMEATQYQALIGNDWLFKVNTMLDWNIQELQLMYQGQHIRVLARCGHFKTPPREKLLIELKEEKKKLTWEAYQVLWGKGKQKEELTWETDDLTWTDNDESELTSSWEWEEDKENKGKGKEEEPTQTITAYNNTYTISQ